ncbi:MAG TPA: amidophosphoribosyltransferase [Bacillota bacterium]|nr:amidophosphoribosyltransferase [Bacillota bacterium]
MGGLEARFDFPHDGDTLREKCGVVGVLDPEARGNVAQLAYTALAGLQHRGEGGAGIVNSVDNEYGSGFVGIKDIGLVSDVFPRGGIDVDRMTDHKSVMSVAQTRWATSGGGGDPYYEAQPFVPGTLAVAHNGNIEMMQRVAESYGILHTVTDSDAYAQTMEMLSGPDALGSAESAFHELLPKIDGGYSVVLGAPDALYGVRDPWGTRPLFYGRFKSGVHMIASERPVLREAGQVVEEHEFAAGEIVRIDRNGEVSMSHIKREVDQLGRCALEAVYLARGDGELDGIPIYDSRWEMGRRLAREHPADADVVIGIPESGIIAAQGYAYESGIPYRVGLFRNPYITRTFIQESPEVRRYMLMQKQRPNTAVIRGKRLVVVDDSIVRGGTGEAMSEVFYAAGATEVHMRVSSAPFIYPCFSGTAISRPDTLFARRHPTHKGRVRALNVTSLGYLSVEGTAESQGGTVDSICVGCMTGKYPFQVPTPTPQGRQLLSIRPV